MITEQNKYGNCEKFDEWLEKSGGYPHWDIEITEPIDISLGVGATYSDETYSNLVTERTDYEKILRLSITSYGSYLNHYYGRLEVPGTIMKLDRGYLSCCGYKTPNYISGFSIEITRKFTQIEYDEDQKRYHKEFSGVKVGDATTRFNSKKELIEATKKVIDKWFTGDWKFKVE